MIANQSSASFSHADFSKTRSATESCRISSCVLCDVQRGGIDNFTRMSGQSPLLSLSELSTELSVMMDSFPIGELGGHLLIVPRRHHVSLAQYPDQEDLRTVVDETSRTLQSMYPDHWLFTFEHGPGQIESQRIKCGGCHVDHAHGHIVLMHKEVTFEDLRSLTEQTLTGLQWDLERVTHESDEPFLNVKQQIGDLPYLQIGFLGESDRMAVTYGQTDVQKAIPSQLLRRLVAVASGQSGALAWNWKLALKQGVRRRLDRYRDEGVSFKTAVERFSLAR